MNEWISVNDRLPSDSLVLVYAPLIVAIGYYHAPKWFLWFGGGEHDKEVDNVTHWMPKPQPPKKL